MSATASLKKVSQKGDAPPISWIGRVSIPGLIHVEDQEADAIALRRIEVRPHEAADPLRAVGARGPGLLTVDEPVIALVLGLASQRREIRAGVRLGVAEGPEDLAPADRGNVLALLLLGAVLEDRRPDHRDAHARLHDERVEGPRRRHLLLQDLGLELGEAAAPVLRGPGRRRPALLAEALAPGVEVRVLAVEELAADQLGAAAGEALRKVFVKPIASLAAEGLECVLGIRHRG